MKKIILISALLEIIYLILSFVLAQIYGQWSYIGEIIRTLLRVISIAFFAYYYQSYFHNENNAFKAKEILTPQFIVALVLFLFFAVAYTNAENETLLWQIVFGISGMTAGWREELFYRGIVQNTLQKKYNCWIALSAATFVFTLSHIQYIYYGQIKELLLIAFAGAIFGSIFIHTGSIVFTSVVHGLYDSILSINLVPFRLNNGIITPVLFLIMLSFLILLIRKPAGSQQTGSAGDSDQDNLSVS